ncbi:MAG: hypothetical protein JSV31_30260 [Desulfobacterales bacterium]|nr:MAG: hypothetical protein JSV31_30260 [Desulfobacterales bacterium]
MFTVSVPTLLRVFQDVFARRYLDRNDFLLSNLHNLFWEPRGHTIETSNLSLSVEEILTIVRDYENQAYGAPPLLGEETERFKNALYVLVKKAVYDGKHSRGRYLNPIIEYARRRFQSITWATFNWDCIFEASYYYSSGQDALTRTNPSVIVELNNWRNQSAQNTFLKLHGGVNWWYENDRLVYLRFGYLPDLNDRWDEFERNEANGSPVILEPSYYKYEDPIYELLRVQWDHFVQSLLESDIVVIIGYSLPEADFEARRALTVGFQSNQNSKYIVVNRSDWVCDRYRRLFGSNRLNCIQESLQNVSDDLPGIIENELAP